MKYRLKILAVIFSILAVFSISISFSGFSAFAADGSFASLSTSEYYFDKLTRIEMPYRLYVPKNYDESKSYQLIVFLHGAGESGNDNISHVLNNKLLETLVSDEYIEKHPCIVVAPQSVRGWNSDDRITLMNILTDIGSKYNIDEKRQVLTGYSMGGTAVWKMLLLYPDYFDAAVTVAGGSISGDLESIKDIPIWIFHAADDGTVDVENSRRMYKALKDIGGNVFMSEPTTGGHSHNLIAFNKPALYNWLFSEDFKLPSDGSQNKFPADIVIICASAAVIVSAGAVIAITAVRRRRTQRETHDFTSK